MATESELSFDDAQKKLGELEGAIQTAEREHAKYEAERASGERDLAQVVEKCTELGVEPEQLDKAVTRQAKTVASAVAAGEQALAGVDKAGAAPATDVDALLGEGEDE